VTISVELRANATRNNLTVAILKAALIAAVNTSQEVATVTVAQLTTVALQVNTQASPDAYLMGVQASVCASHANGACEVRVVGTARRQLQTRRDSADETRRDSADEDADEETVVSAKEVGAGEAQSSDGDGHDRGPRPESGRSESDHGPPNSEGRPPVPAPKTGHSPGHAVPPGEEPSSSPLSSWASRAFSRAGGLWSATTGGLGGSRLGGFRLGGDTTGGRLEGTEEQGVAESEAATADGGPRARRLQTSGYLVTFEIGITPTASALLDTTVSPPVLVTALVTALGAALGSTPTVSSPAVTSTTATISFPRIGTSVDAAAALSSTLSSTALIATLAAILGVTASDLVITTSTIFPPGAPPSSPPQPPPPSPPPYTSVRTAACDACTCRNGQYDDALCMGGCTWQTDTLRRICRNLDPRAPQFVPTGR